MIQKNKFWKSRLILLETIMLPIKTLLFFFLTLVTVNSPCYSDNQRLNYYDLCEKIQQQQVEENNHYQRTLDDYYADNQCLNYYDLCEKIQQQHVKENDGNYYHDISNSYCLDKCDYYENNFNTCCLDECDSVWLNPHRLYLSHTEGRWYDNTNGYTTLGVFWAAEQPTLFGGFPLIDVRLHQFNNGKKAANIGGGFRFMGCDCIYGVNAFYDYRVADFASYHQLGLGIEYLCPCLDFRLNGYFPIGNKEGRSSTTVFDSFANPYFYATCQEHQPSMPGCDFEFGRWLKRTCNPCDMFDFYVAVGGHYFNSSENNHRYGCEARALSHFGRYFTFEVKAGYDHVSKGMIQGTINFTFPLLELFNRKSNCCNTCCINPEVYQPIHRQEIIVLDKKGCCWTWNWDNCGCSSCCGSN